MQKVVEEESTKYADNFNGDTFSHASSAQIENANAIFTSENLDKSGELVDAVNNLTINYAKCYESNTATASGAQGDLTSNPETVTHASSGIFEKKLLSFRTIHVLTMPTNPGIAAIILTTQTLLTPATKEIISDTAVVSTCMSRTVWQVSRTGVDRSTPGDSGNVIGIVETSSPDLIGIIGTASTCGINLSQEVGNIRKSTSPDLVRQCLKLDATVDRKFSNNPDSTSIFSKLIGDKLSDGSSQGLYTRCRMNLMAYRIQILTPQFVDLGLSTIDELNKGSGLSTPATTFRRPVWCPLERV